MQIFWQAEEINYNSLQKDKHGFIILDKDYELDLKKGDEFVLKVGRKFKKVVVE